MATTVTPRINEEIEGIITRHVEIRRALELFVADGLADTLALDVLRSEQQILERREGLSVE